MRAAALLLVAAVACRDHKAPPRPAAGADAAVVAPTVDAAAAAAPGPLSPALAPGARGVQLVDLEYGGYQSQGLPAMRADGGQVLVLARADDGGRGYLDLTARLLDGATGAVVKEVVLADADATADAIADDDAHPGGDALATVEDHARAAVAQVNALVGGDWRPLTGARRDPAAGPPAARETLAVGPLAFTLVAADRQLVVTRGGDVAAIHDLRRLIPLDVADDTCGTGAPVLAAALVDPATHRAVIEVDFVPPGDLCAAAPPVFAIVPAP